MKNSEIPQILLKETSNMWMGWLPTIIFDKSELLNPQQFIIAHCTMIKANFDKWKDSSLDSSNSFQVDNTVLHTCTWACVWKVSSAEAVNGVWSDGRVWKKFFHGRTSTAMFPEAFLSTDEWWHRSLNSDQMAKGNTSQTGKWQISCYLAELWNQSVDLMEKSPNSAESV